MGNIKWVGNHIEIDPPAKPKKITGTRLAAILGYNRWSTPFEAWCAITRTYEKPFEDTIYTNAGKVIEPKITEYLNKRYFMDLKTPEDVYGIDPFKKTFGDFYRDTKVFGGMWDALGEDFIVEIKTTKRAEDWQGEPPLYYMLQGALYAWLKGFDDVTMVCAFLTDADYDRPEKFKPSVDNVILYPFKISERFPNFADEVINEAVMWWDWHVAQGFSPDFDEKADAEILKALRTNTVQAEAAAGERSIGDMVAEYELITADIAAIRKREGIDDLEAQANELKDQIKDALQKSFRDGDKKAEYSSATTVYTVTKKAGAVKLDSKALEKEMPSIYAKYAKEGKPSFALTTAAVKTDD